MKTNSTIKLTQTETSKTVEFSIPNEEAENITAGLIKNNHLKGLYTNYCIVNQEFLSYILSLKLSGIPSNILFFFLSQMDKENKILINNKILMKVINASEPSIIKALKTLEKQKVIIKIKYAMSKYEYEINYDCINPQFAFKNKSTRENITKHKALMAQETPYIKQYNTDGDIDLINTQSGEIFETQKQFERKPKKEILATDFNFTENPFD
jgi:DNA-binding Lrp family transcriptional regulator